MIQWLVSQVLESRQTRGDVIRRYATWQFDQHFGQQQQQQQQTDVEVSKPVSRLADVYQPKRKFRQKVIFFFTSLCFKPFQYSYHLNTRDAPYLSGSCRALEGV